jgi:adenylate cyclase
MKRIPILLGLILVAFAVWMQITPQPIIRHWSTQLENIAYDFQFRAKLLTRFKPFNTSIAIVDIDDRSLSAEGRWPWPRSKLADLLDQIRENGAVVAAFDILFPEKENNLALVVFNKVNEKNLVPPSQIKSILDQIKSYFEDDDKFSNSIKKIDTILGLTFVPREQQQGAIPSPLLTLSTPVEKELAFIIPQGYISNITELQQSAKSGGFINVFADDDGVIRRLPLFIRYKDQLYPSLALEAARLYLLSNVALITAPYGDTYRLEGIKLGDKVISTDAHSQVIIPFQGKSYTFPYYSATDVLNKKLPPDSFAGKIIFIGTSATGLGDIKPTSVQSTFPGIEIQATVTDGLLKNNFSYSPDWSLGAELSLTVVLGCLFAFIFPYLGPRVLTLLIFFIPFALIMIDTWLWNKTGLILSILYPILLTLIIGMLNVIFGYFFETRRRERLKDMFGQYVPEEHIDEMLKSSGDYGLFGEDRDMTVLFADIRQFTAISEKLSAAQLKELLNEVFTPMTEIIFKYRGTIDKYVGDLIMAFWGAPLKNKHHAQNGIATALDMQDKIKALSPTLTAKGWPEIKIGIGLNSGIMSVGDMGSKYRRNYTVLGDAVNLASRIESLTKHYGVSIIVSEHTQKAQHRFVFRQLDKVQVKGIEKGINLFEVVCRKHDLTPALENELQLNDRALNYYFQQKWESSRKLFAQLTQDKPHKKLYKLYLARLAKFEKNPPPVDWDGVYIHTEK